VNACRFDQCSVSPFSLKGIKNAEYEKMTMVQEATLVNIIKVFFLKNDLIKKKKNHTHIYSTV
jgi:superfamily II DNA/RNA helicase